jgi:hypothetical protein
VVNNFDLMKIFLGNIRYPAIQTDNTPKNMVRSKFPVNNVVVLSFSKLC